MDTARPLAYRPSELLTALQEGGDPLLLAQGCLTQALEESTFEHSVGNCHTAGMDSVVLRDYGEGGMVRFFAAHRGSHALDSLLNGEGHFTLGAHNHRFPIALLPLTPGLTNVTFQEDPRGSTRLHRYIFSSALDEDSQGIATVAAGERRFSAPSLDRVSPGEGVLMEAARVHTVLLKDEAPLVGWVVVEGPSEMRSYIYSPRDNLTVTSKNLYTPLKRDEAQLRTEELLNLSLLG